MALSTIQQAPVQDGSGIGLLPAIYNLTSSDPAIASIALVAGVHTVLGLAAGNVTLTATRKTDGATATLSVDVTAAAGFTIKLGAPTLR